MISFREDISTDLLHTLLSIRFEMRKHLRRRRLFLVTLLALILPTLFYLLPQFFDVEFPDSGDAFASNNLSFLSILVIISGSLFAGDAISGEFENKTSLSIFPLPHRRTSILMGKYVAALLATCFAISLYYAVTSLEIIAIYGIGDLSLGLLKSWLVALLYSAGVISVVFFFSSILSRSITSTLAGFFSLLFVLPIVANVLRIVEVNPWYIITHEAGLVTDIFALPSPFAGQAGPWANYELFLPEFYTGVAVMAAHAIGFLIISVILANRKQVG
jgi:ABC-type transport system involved in multi-copper enzyme maturation permease subunit